jgi:hypothetical protein
MPGNSKHPQISFRKDFDPADLDFALSSNGGPQGQAVNVERRNINVLQELLYQHESVLLQLGKALPHKTSALRRLFGKGHTLIAHTRLIMQKFKAKQDQIPVTCQCECKGPPVSTLEDSDNFVDNSDIEVEYDIEEVGYL